jgi:hypothetical protein
MVTLTDKTYSDAEVLMALRKSTKGLSVRKAGVLFGVSGAYIHDVLKRRRGISETIASYLGFILVPPPKPQPRQWKRKPSWAIEKVGK